MRASAVVERATARADVEQAVDFYAAEVGPRVALRFIASLEKAYRHLSRHPASGSLRHADALELPGMRSWPLSKFPYVIFYLEQPDCVDIWRVLHQHLDVPAWMRF